MIKHNLVAILYSNKNHELSFKIQKWCNENQISFVNVVDILDLSVKITKLNPKFLFVDTSRNNFLLNAFKMFTKEIEETNTKIICITNNESNPIVVEELKKCSTCLNLAETKEFIYSYSPELTDLKNKNPQLIWDGNIGELLIHLGFNPKHTGYQYLKSILNELMLKNNDIILLNQYYSVVAGLFKTNSANIERNIRNAILKAWQTFGKNHWDKTLNFNETSKNPTNREFICYTIEYLNECGNSGSY